MSEKTPAGEFVNLRYCVWGAGEAGEIGHPQEIMKKLGITYRHATPQSIADQWWFWLCTVPADLELPEYLSKLNIKPVDAIGFGLSEQVALELTEIANNQ